jgi:lipoprotein-releasing system permease protein
MGMPDWSIRKIFLYQAGGLILKGMLYGNIIGLSLCALQYFFGIIQLNPEVYYLKKVPIDLDFMAWVFLNVGTLVVCLAALIIPSVVITRIVPARSIKFN